MDEAFEDEQVNRLLSLSHAESFQFLKQLGHAGTCPCCQTGNWHLGRYKERATLVNLPILTAPDGMAHWAFFMSCSHCGLTKLVDAAAVIRVMDGDTPNVR